MSQREILFKAKRTDNGEWVEGFPYYGDYSGAFILQNKSVKRRNARTGEITLGDEVFPIEVDGRTYCQYTELTDKNGKKIFEGDRVVLDKGEEYEKNGFVSYSNGVFIIQFEKTWDFLCTNLEYAETVGNIHDN